MKDILNTFRRTNQVAKLRVHDALLLGEFEHKHRVLAALKLDGLVNFDNVAAPEHVRVQNLEQRCSFALDIVGELCIERVDAEHDRCHTILCERQDEVGGASATVSDAEVAQSCTGCVWRECKGGSFLRVGSG